MGFLKLQIDECHSSILCLHALFSCSFSERSALINNSKTSWVKEFCHSKEQQTFTKQREKHDRKFCHLLSKRSPVNSGSSLKDKWVMNLPSEELSMLEQSGLEKGLKFAIALHKIRTAEIVAAVKESISQINGDPLGKSRSRQRTQILMYFNNLVDLNIFLSQRY